MPFIASLRMTWGVARTTVASAHKASRLSGAVSPVYVTMFSSETFSRSTAIVLCWSTKPVVGAMRTIFSLPFRRYSAMAIHSTAVFPNPVGMTIRLEKERIRSRERN